MVEAHTVTGKPAWLKVRIQTGPGYRMVSGLVAQHGLNTVCEDARCPNIWECWNRGTATFMILGNTCTRSCGFCSVKTGRPAEGLDWDEPRRVAEAVKRLGLQYVVITSVNRDEREDGGAPIFAEVVRNIHEAIPGCKVEVLVPDFKGYRPAIDAVVEARPEVLAHNVETVARLYRTVRPQAEYARSLEVLQYAHERGATTKSSVMVGLGETIEEIRGVMRDLREACCDLFTVGQYLQPGKDYLPVERFVHPDEFEALKEYGLTLGFRHVAAGPLVRSSYHADAAHAAAV